MQEPPPPAYEAGDWAPPPDAPPADAIDPLAKDEALPASAAPAPQPYTGGPAMEAGLAGHVRVVGQPDYSAYEGGAGPHYSSVIVMRKGMAGRDVAAPGDGRALLPLDGMRGTRLAYNETLSRSGFLEC